jgi:uncharacterized protein involved in cysteine biosynthesis
MLALSVLLTYLQDKYRIFCIFDVKLHATIFHAIVSGLVSSYCVKYPFYNLFVLPIIVTMGNLLTKRVTRQDHRDRFCLFT